MRIFVLAVLAGITAAHVYPKGLKSRQDPESLSLPKCSVPCLENNGVTLSCIEGAGSDKKSDQCICDAFRGLSGPNIERCIEEVCNVKDIMDLEAYLAQACFGASVRTFPRRLRVCCAPLLSTLELTRRTSGHHDLSAGATFG
ncbi:hypothetical protein C8Q70DRAFT_271018 [Cubamyces menziesii]|nr:hypothetical protein C8Q70DRAFT_271018 [Cubamyces menziesii]